jgi:16S rRNA (guanine966-N2)-methyltransferase
MHSRHREDIRLFMAQNQVRIISGKYKGRKLRFPSRNSLRPTLGRARETLFNWLSADLPQARCLDLFAGSGALGFEALSRGAASVTLVDNDALAIRALKANAATLEADAADVTQAHAISFLRQIRSRSRSEPATEPLWDLVFLDPPFDSPVLVARALDALVEQELLGPRGLVYIEHDQRIDLKLNPDQWSSIKSSRAGESCMELLARTS